MSEAEYKLLGLVAVALIGLAAATTLKLSPIERNKSLSSHVAKTKLTYLLFALALVGGSALFYVYGVGYLVPKYQLQMLFEILLTAAVVCIVIAALIPEAENRSKALVHRTAAYTLAALLPFTTGCILLAESASTALVIPSAVTISYTVMCVVLYFGYPPSRRYYLLFQVTYLVLHVGVLVAAGFI